MPTIDTPIIIDPVNESIWAEMGGDEAALNKGRRTQLFGPYELSGATWMITITATQIQAQKSLDGGNTWLPQDASNCPQAPGIVLAIAAYQFGNVIYTLRVNDTAGHITGLRVKGFDTSTGLWGSDTSDGTSPTDLVATFDFHVTAANTFNVVYGKRVVTAHSLWSKTYSGGVWGSATQFGLDMTDPVLTGYFVDTVAASAHATYSGNLFFGAAPLTPNPMRHVEIQSDGTILASELISSDVIGGDGPGGFYLTYPAPCRGTALRNDLFFPYVKREGGSVRLPAVFSRVGGVWASQDLSNIVDDGIGTPGGASLFALTIDTTVYLLWLNKTSNDDGDPIRQLRYLTTDDGVTYTTIQTPYDVSIHPPANYDVSGDLYDLSVASLISGDIGVGLEAVLLDGNNPVHYLTFASSVVPPTPLSITCGGSPSGLVGTPYSNFLPASGGTPPYTFAITSGSLPPGLVLNSTSGEISGTPTTPGTYPFTVQVTDSLAAVASVDCSIIIISTLLITCGSPPEGVVGLFYSHTFPASGGVPPYVFTLVTGFLPPGLTLDSTTGIISGIPTQGGTYAFTINVRDAALTSMNVICSITIGSVSVGCTNIQSGTVGVPYSQAFPATGGTPPYTFTVIAGQVPFGLSLDAATGTLSGTPTAPGTYQVVIEVTDANGITDTAICVQIIGCQ